ncbi:MAG: hypothetical protein FRX48_03211 [Lasallia pustulata]|uniref:Uncharacterized protein n=1 Tax=Lasallia pustulata TaxID=136370 RepID=A0A5M8PXS2_9LECA|nr:MAG: hypothetical protein FRX48_03211 [Lasallia pustulata]
MATPKDLSPPDDGIPTYEESVLSGATPSTSTSTSTTKPPLPPAPTPSLPTQLTSTRSQRIHSLTTAYILPLLTSQAQRGLYKTTFILIPSTTSPLASTAGDETTVVGFPSDDHIQLVRLHGSEHSLEFWRQPAVVRELEVELKARLTASGHRVEEEQQPLSPAVAPSASPKGPKRSFFSRRASEKAAPVSRPVGSAGTWSTPASAFLGAGQVRVKVGLQDVCLRLVTEMGLYETRTGMAVVVGVEIGS